MQDRKWRALPAAGRASPDCRLVLRKDGLILKILIVDDEKSIVDIISYNLKKEGYDPIVAYDGKEGLALALSENPELILLDIMMPYLDGFEVCRRVREVSQVPIIMLTARV